MARRSVLAVAVQDHHDNCRDSLAVDLRLPHERGSPLDVVGVDRVEEVVNSPDACSCSSTKVPSKFVISIPPVREAPCHAVPILSPSGMDGRHRRPSKNPASANVVDVSQIPRLYPKRAISNDVDSLIDRPV